jgi:hypothetical protein
MAGNESTNRSLYRIGGAAALTMVLLTIAEIVLLSITPQPGSVREWFALFARAPFSGIVGFWGLEIPMYVMFVLVFLALYAALGRRDARGRHGYADEPMRETENTRAAPAIALALVLVGSAVFFATNNPFTMLTLSNRYAAAATEADRTALISAGEAVVAGTNQRAIGGFNIALFLVSVAGVLVSSAMSSHEAFGRRIAALGMLAHGLSLADNLRQLLTSSLVISLLVIVTGAVLLVIWFTTVGLRLLRLGRLR